MANVIKNFLGYLKLNDEDDFDEFFDEDEKYSSARESSKTRIRERNNTYEDVFPERKERKTAQPIRSTTSENTDSEARKEKVQKVERTTNKVVPIRTTARGLEVCIMKPVGFEDSQDICDLLLTGRAVVVNLEGFDAGDAQRVMDFISGAVYAINGKLHQISRYIFIFAPDTIDVSGDYLGLIADDGFGVPMIKKEF